MNPVMPMGPKQTGRGEAGHRLGPGAGLISFGRAFIANPDLVERLRTGLPVAPVDEATYGRGGGAGHLNVPGLRPHGLTPGRPGHIEPPGHGQTRTMSIDATDPPGVQVCSLKRDTPQSVPADSPYTVVRFPFGSAESTDRFSMHQVNQPDGYVVTDWDSDDRSGLIWPSTAGWGVLYAMVQWEAGNYGELRDQFVRDPLGLTPAPHDTTATEHRPPSPGMQCWTKHWGVFVDPAVPLAVRVTHDDGVARNIVLAEFKLVVHRAA